MTIDWKNALEAELSALRTAAITDAAETDQLNKACDQRAAHEYKLMGEIDALKAQNAELLAALESAEPHLLGYACKAVLEAIAKARGDL